MYTHQLQLSIKLCKNKPSRIAVKYPYKFQALRSYEELIRKYSHQSITVKLEPRHKLIDLTLTSDEYGGILSYKNLTYKAEELKTLIHSLNADLPIEFVHIYSEANILLIAKPFNQETFFRISSCEVIGISDL